MDKYLAPYDTIYGKLTKTNLLVKEIEDYVIGKDTRSLGYEYGDGSKDAYVVFITGKNDDEKAMPSWEHPILIKDRKHNTMVVSDIRKYVSGDDRMENIHDTANSNTGLEFVILRALITRDFLNEEIGEFNNIRIGACAGFVGLVLACITHTIRLDMEDELAVRVAVTYYYNSLLYPIDEREKRKDRIIARTINGAYPGKISTRDLEYILNKVDTKINDIDSLVSIIKCVVKETTRRYIERDSLIAGLTGMWFGHGVAGTLTIALEHMPTWIAVLLSNLDNRSYKKTKLYGIIEANKKAINPNELIKFKEQYIKHNTL